jgi:hypothetical protein
MSCPFFGHTSSVYPRLPSPFTSKTANPPGQDSQQLHCIPSSTLRWQLGTSQKPSSHPLNRNQTFWSSSMLELEPSDSGYVIYGVYGLSWSRAAPQMCRNLWKRKRPSRSSSAKVLLDSRFEYTQCTSVHIHHGAHPVISTFSSMNCETRRDVGVFVILVRPTSNHPRRTMFGCAGHRKYAQDQPAIRYKAVRKSGNYPKYIVQKLSLRQGFPIFPVTRMGIPPLNAHRPPPRSLPPWRRHAAGNADVYRFQMANNFGDIGWARKHGPSMHCTQY